MDCFHSLLSTSETETLCQNKTKLSCHLSTFRLRRRFVWMIKSYLLVHRDMTCACEMMVMIHRTDGCELSKC